MSKIYEWLLEQLCLQCSLTNEFCDCPVSQLTEPIGDDKND